MSLERQYSTCGFIGMNEAVELMGFDILKEEGQQFALEILDAINKVNDEMSKRYKVPVNCEQVPGENSAVKLAEADRVLGYNKQYTIYSNQFIPLTKKADIYDRIKLQSIFDKHLSSDLRNSNCLLFLIH